MTPGPKPVGQRRSTASSPPGKHARFSWRRVGVAAVLLLVGVLIGVSATWIFRESLDQAGGLPSAERGGAGQAPVGERANPAPNDPSTVTPTTSYPL